MYTEVFVSCTGLRQRIVNLFGSNYNERLVLVSEEKLFVDIMIAQSRLNIKGWREAGC